MAIGSPQWMYASGEDYTLDQSLRFFSDDVHNLQKTPSSAGNRKTWTLSFWCKPSDIESGEQSILTAGGSCSGRLGVMFDGSMHLALNICGTGDLVETTAVYRDPSAWYHFVVAFDTTQGTATNRVKIYTNGVLQTLTHNSSFSEDTDYMINNTVLHSIGALSNSVTSAGYCFSGYLAEMHFIDGTALTPTSFGETGDYGEWKPIEVSGLTYGTNGFYLSFAGGGIMSATGGTITTDGDYKVHSFTSNGTFTPTLAGEVEYLVIAGGGGGGASRGGGGGAGGYRTGYLAVATQAYSITVGAGGAGGASGIDDGAKGSNSVFSSITSEGGGLGRGYKNPTADGGDGGSGGGAGGSEGSPKGVGGSATSGQGYDGGDTINQNLSGGGGGSSAVGADAAGTTPGVGGAGTASSITGASVTRAGGGGGSRNDNPGASGGSGGGGDGGGDNVAVGSDGTANTGSGGGGGGANGGDGGSGIVILRYKFQ